MPLLEKQTYTSKDYWNLPDGKRAELINGNCEVIPAPFAVNLQADDKGWVEPDISVICDRSKLTPKGCVGAPDMIIDPEKEHITIHQFEEDSAPIIYPINSPVNVNIFSGLVITISKLL